MKELRLTSFNTIVGDDFNEIFIEDFIKMIDTRLGEKYSIYYEKSLNTFIVIYDGVKYYLTLDKTTMDNYAFGQYNNFTLKLKQLIDRREGIEQENADENEIALRKEQIIKDADKGLIPNDEARRVYLEHLKDEKKFSFSKIKTYFSNLLKDFKDSYNLVDKWIFDTNIWPFSVMYEGVLYFALCLAASLSIVLLVTFGLAIISNVLGGISDKWLYLELLAIIPEATYLVPATMFLGNQAKRRYSRLMSSIKTKKLNNHKIKELTEELKRESIKSNTYDSFDKTLPEPIKEQINPLEDKILANLYDIVERLKYINPIDRKALLDEVKDISNEYVRRLDTIKDENLEDGLNLNEDNYFKLDTDILARIALLEHRMQQIRANDVDDENINKQYLTLNNAIDACYNDEEKVIGGEHSKARRPEKRNK